MSPSGRTLPRGPWRALVRASVLSPPLGPGGPDAGGSAISLLIRVEIGQLGGPQAERLLAAARLAGLRGQSSPETVRPLASRGSRSSLPPPGRPRRVPWGSRSRVRIEGEEALYGRLRARLLREGPAMEEIADEVRSVLRATTRAGPRSVRLAHGRRLQLAGKTLVMGVVNVTPDSFFDGGRYASTDDAVRHGLRLVEEGADLLDIGGESTRPGSSPVPVREELRRVLPVLLALRSSSSVPLSVDTSKPEVARQALRNGADLVNDVSGLGDRRMREVVRRAGAAAVVMHMRGRPRDMQTDTRYDDLLAEVFAELAERTQRAEREGIAPDQLVVDPGVGFGKSFEGNLELLRRLGELRSLGYPVMVGASRKSFLGALLGGAPPEHRGEASVTAAVLASLRGASIVRVHDVGPTVEALRVADAFRRGWPRGASGRSGRRSVRD